MPEDGLCARALAVVTTTDIDAKLAPLPEDLRDEAWADRVPLRPGRPEALVFRPAAAAKVPSAAGWHDPDQRVRIVHGLANHELQAVELVAWALLAFPQAPQRFRRGLAGLLRDEQRHCQLYITRLADWGVSLGDFPVTGYFWGKLGGMTTPLGFVVSLCLTFENASLDHMLELGDAARVAGDLASADVIARVRADEVGHVRFGWHWLAAFKRPEQSMWEAWNEACTWPLRPALGRGRHFDAESRRAVGMDEDVIERLQRAQR